MKPAPFEYLRAGSVAEALAALAEHEDAKVLAGGQSLLTLMNLRLARPAMLIDIGGLAELDRVFSDVDDVLIGALVRHRRVETDPELRALVPLAAAAAGHIGHVGIRNRGTLGGTLAHADPAAELPLVMVTLGATCYVESRADGVRAVPAEQFFLSYYTSALRPDELLTWVRVPRLRAGQGWGFVELARRHGDFAMAGAAAVVSVDGRGQVCAVRAGLMSAGETPLLVSGADGAVGAAAAARRWDELAAEWTAGLEFSEDPEYARALARVALRRALTEAATRAESTPEAA
ncbi:MAG TPA: FAD binding domain-containing protein [Pseudonocardia sp.]|nr:FAD binding domain-containing protein [Pseudonocardia sp.]